MKTVTIAKIFKLNQISALTKPWGIEVYLKK